VSVSSDSRAPNVLFIITDQQRADSLGIVNGWTDTPHLDALARQGTLFTSCFTTSPMCIPARFSLMSGLYPHALGVQANREVTYPVGLATWFGELRGAGYRTSMFGKLHLHPDRGDLRDNVGLIQRFGFDDVDEVPGPRALRFAMSNLSEIWIQKGVRTAYQEDVVDRKKNHPWAVRPSPVGVDLYYDTYVGETAARYLREYDRADPWCCYVGFPGPHEPWDAPEPWGSLYQPSDMPAPRVAPRSVAEHPAGDLEARLEHRPHVPPEDVAALRANYAGEVSLIDHLIGQIFQVIEARGEWDNTIVVFTSDHGEMNGDAGLLRKGVLLDGAVRIPLIIRDPAGTHVSQHHHPVELIDVGSTVVDLALGSGDFRMGRSMSDVVRGHALSPPRSDALCEYDGEVMLATDDWKIVLNAQGETYLLFDRSGDESVNLAGAVDYADVQRELEARVLRRVVAGSLRDPVYPTEAAPSAETAPSGSGFVASLARRLLGGRRRPQPKGGATDKSAVRQPAATPGG
jgi:arylsulfatase